MMGGGGGGGGRVRVRDAPVCLQSALDLHALHNSKQHTKAGGERAGKSVQGEGVSVANRLDAAHRKVCAELCRRHVQYHPMLMVQTTGTKKRFAPTQTQALMNT